MDQDHIATCGCPSIKTEENCEKKISGFKFVADGCKFHQGVSKVLKISLLNDRKIASLETAVTFDPVNQFHSYLSNFAQKQEFYDLAKFHINPRHMGDMAWQS